jgi:hypothetical protein
MAYDRADWHYGGNFPKDLPSEAGGTHIGIFVAWAITRGMEGDLHRAESVESLSAVRERRMTGREFLEKECDEKFTAEDLNEEGNAFTASYYEKEGPGGYLADYEEALGEGLPTLYHVQDTWENFEKVAVVLDQRYYEWKGSRH